MPGIVEFYGALSNTSKDVFLSVANDLHASSPAGKIARLSAFMTELKEEIDQINKRRKNIGEQLSNVEMLIAEVTKYLETNENLELVMFRESLLNIASQLKTEIFLLKLDNKLAKKFDVVRRRDALVQRQELANKLFGTVLKDVKKARTENPQSAPEAAKEPVAKGAEIHENVLEDIEAEKTAGV